MLDRLKGYLLTARAGLILILSFLSISAAAPPGMQQMAASNPWTFDAASKAMVRSDGTRVEQMIGGGRERQRELLFSQNGVAVRILATRYDGNGEAMLDTWQVHFGLIVRRLRPEWEAAPIASGITAEIVTAVTQVLPNWPLGLDEKSHPANQFEITTGGFDDDRRGTTTNIDDVISHPEKYATFYSAKVKTLYFLHQ